MLFSVPDIRIITLSFGKNIKLISYYKKLREFLTDILPCDYLASIGLWYKVGFQDLVPVYGIIN